MSGSGKRNLNKEHQDNEDRQYAYDFDYLMHDYIIREFQKHFKGKALEMGCYKGEFTKKLLEHFDEVTVLEGSSDLITETKRNVGDKPEFINSMFEDADLNAEYGSVFLMHTLEHLDNPVAILSKINNWLSDDGSLFLVVPNAFAPSRQIAVKMGLIETPTSVTKGEHEHGHRRTYDMKLLKQHATEAGLSIKGEGGVFFKPFANFQFDQLMQTEIISKEYLDGCYELGKEYPELCASIYLICGRSK